MNQRSLVPPPPIEVDIKAWEKLQNALHKLYFNLNKQAKCALGQAKYFRGKPLALGHQIFKYLLPWACCLAD